METVFISGAARGIGLALTQRCLQQGFRVFASYRGAPSAALSELQEHAALQLLELEVTDGEAIAKVADELADIELDMLINNAGVLGRASNPTSR